MKRTIEDRSQEQKKRKDKIIEVIEQEGNDSNEELEFEDEWEDEYEEEIVEGMEMDEQAEGEGEGEAEGEGGQMDIKEGKIEEEQDEENQSFQTFIPGRDKLEEGEVLDYDNSAYDMFHSLNVEWPCLSFDILPDKLGAHRTKFPMTVYAVAGTQADTPQNNKILLMKMSSLCKTKHDDEDSDAEDSQSEDEDMDDSDPILETKTIKHHGGVNRIRATKLGEETTLAATWADTGKVHIWDISQPLRALDAPQHDKPPAAPLHTFTGHPTEGFSLDWSPTVPGRLLTGDCRKFIYLWENAQASWNVNLKPFTGHTDSVEDLQWSPNEKDVFASCSVDKTIKIWDARRREKAVLSVVAHKSDVNVISWNRPAPHLMLSGADDGTFSIWDLRNFKSGVPAAHFKWHNGPITSVAWHPSEESVLAVAGADDQISIWDLSLEQDTESNQGAAGEPEVPPQLLFIHQGQKDVKELHWHRQIPGAILSTAQSGFNVFKTISV